MMQRRQARADVTPVRQTTQYNCVATSLAMALKALGFADFECEPDRVNRVLGALPLQGASFEQVAAAASHYGCRTTLVVPATLGLVRSWTDAGKPVMIGWNTGNEWSHASLVFDVTDTHVLVADPNIPNPDTLVRTLTHDEFYDKWWEKSGPGYKIRRPAMCIEREITPDGRQVMAGSRTAAMVRRTAGWGDKPSRPLQTQPDYGDTNNDEGAGSRVPRGDDSPQPDTNILFAALRRERVATKVAFEYSNTVPPYEADHGYGQPLAGGTDVMRQLLNNLRRENGLDPRPECPRIAARIAERANRQIKG